MLCEKCGTTVKQPRVFKKTEGKSLIKKVIAITIALVIMMTCAVGCGGTKTVKVQDFIEVEFSPAYNGYAEPTLEVDTDGLNSMMNAKKTIAYLKNLVNSSKEYNWILSGMVNAMEEDPEELLGFTDFFVISLAEDYEGLKNGDKIKVVISLDEIFAEITNESVKQVAKKLGIKLSQTEFEIKVKGLEDLNAINVNMDKLLKVNFGKYEGYASPSVTVDYKYFEELLVNEVVADFTQKANNEVKNLLKQDCQKWFTAEFDKAYEGLKNGDTIKVNIVLNDAFGDCGISVADFEAGLALNLNGGTNTYTVKGLTEPKNVIDILEGIEQYIQ